MVSFSVPSDNSGLADALIENGGLDYFDSITYDSGAAESTRKTMLTKGGTNITIVENWDSSTVCAKINGYNLNAYSNDGSTRFFGYGYKADNAIVLIGNNSRSGYSANGYYSRPLIICKTKKGGACVITPRSTITGSSSNEKTSSPEVTSTGDVIATFHTFMVSPEGEARNFMFRLCQQNNDNNIITTANFYTAYDQTKDVYFCLNRPYYGTGAPFAIEIDSVPYMSFAYNTILVKST
jgi:hypothetical protein